MSEIEKETADFMKRIVKTLRAAILWMLLNMSFGIYFGWMFFGDVFKIGNLIFYLFMAGSLAGLLYYFYRLWRKSFH